METPLKIIHVFLGTRWFTGQIVKRVFLIFVEEYLLLIDIIYLMLEKKILTQMYSTLVLDIMQKLCAHQLIKIEIAKVADVR